MAFQWDERKRLRNIAKHGFDFLQAEELFDRPHVIVPAKRSQPEERFWPSARSPADGQRSSTPSARVSAASFR
jgi:uncharacterized DUF497 family protein